MFKSLVDFVREQYRTVDIVPLHAPVFSGKEREYLVDAVDSTFVSSVGRYVDRFELEIATFTGSQKATATVNGTAALHIALILAGVKMGELVITQALTFVATCNAISYCGAQPIFIDVDRRTLGLSPALMDEWLKEYAYLGDDGMCRTRDEDRIIRACLPMHTFGHPADLDGLVAVCNRWNLFLVEDAAESLGSLYKNRHTGTFGRLGILSFNGNKIITTGGGGMILSNMDLGKKAKHLTTTAKKQHPFEFNHDEIGYNYRLPNINAALGCAQILQLNSFLRRKRNLALNYGEFFKNSSLEFIYEPPDCFSNYWLNAVICEDKSQRDGLLSYTNNEGIMTRPIWSLISNMRGYENCRRGGLETSEWLEQRVVNLPSGVTEILSE